MLLSGYADRIGGDSRTRAGLVADAESQLSKVRDDSSVFRSSLCSALYGHRHGIDEVSGVRHDRDIGLRVWVCSDQKGVLVVAERGSSIYHRCSMWRVLCL